MPCRADPAKTRIDAAAEAIETSRIGDFREAFVM
jgi:hypothetical protein